MASASWTMGGGRVAEKKQRLTTGRHHGQNAPDVADEAHVEHAVGLVQHQHLELGERHGPLPEMVEQTAGRRHQDVHAALQHSALRVDVGAADDDPVGERQVSARSSRCSRRSAGRARGWAPARVRAAGGGGHRRRGHPLCPPGAAEWAARRQPSCRCRSGRSPVRLGRPAPAAAPPPEWGSDVSWCRVCRARIRGGNEVKGFEAHRQKVSSRASEGDDQKPGG